MKLSLKHKSSALLASGLVTVFFLLHYYVYLGNASGEVPVLQSYTDSPVDLPELLLCEEKKPSYLNPFRKVQFTYQVEENGTYTECEIIEEATALFTSDMRPTLGDPYDYWNGFDEDGFGRPQIGYTYANLIFFTVQYLLMSGFVFVLLRPEKRT